MASSNFHIPYTIERAGQIEFFDNYGIPYADDDSVLIDNTDGVYNGNIFEFKLSISNLNKTLFQAIKYLSKMRINGESVPATILLIDLNATTAYVYHSRDYFDDIHKVYSGAASRDNDSFVAGAYIQKLDYSDMAQSASLRKILIGNKVNPDEMYMPIDIDENCIVGWAERYYREKPKASKGDFLGDDTGTAVKVTGEIRDPRHFKGLINPYPAVTNEKFKYLLDCLNDRLSKKDLGAFYTPIPYAKKAAELVHMAVDRVPEGNDYIILDRCAGTGNLEAALIGLTDKHGEELIEHCVVSTYEYYEYKVLSERLGDKVRDIIPPSEANVVYENGKVANADAMSEDFINNPIIQQYVGNPQCTVILFENPPYRDTSSADKSEKGTAGKSYLFGEMKKHLHQFTTTNVSTARDISNQFIWSGFKYYLKKPEDSYVLFSPIKYWKTLGIVNQEFLAGFVMNRAFFHATESAITCILWSKRNALITSLPLEAFNINDGNIVKEADITVRKAYKTLNAFYDGRKDPNDVPTNVWTEYSGREALGRKTDSQPVYNKNIIGYLRSDGFTIAPLTAHLVRQMTYNARGTYLRDSNYQSLLPLWVAKLYPLEKWFEKDVIVTSSDGGNAYAQDPQFLKSCLIYSCLSNQNKCLSFLGSDGREYQNELCFDNSKTSFAGMPVPPSAVAELPFALKDLNKYAMSPATQLDDEEKALMELWNKVLEEARKTANYNPHWNYGTYQIKEELNTSHPGPTGKATDKVWDYPVLNGHLKTLSVLLKTYYKSHIADKMFKYELLK